MLISSVQFEVDDPALGTQSITNEVRIGTAYSGRSQISATTMAFVTGLQRELASFCASLRWQVQILVARECRSSRHVSGESVAGVQSQTPNSRPIRSVGGTRAGFGNCSLSDVLGLVFTYQSGTFTAFGFCAVHDYTVARQQPG
jgi:hypothetical protein